MFSLKLLFVLAVVLSFVSTFVHCYPQDSVEPVDDKDEPIVRNKRFLFTLFPFFGFNNQFFNDFYNEDRQVENLRRSQRIIERYILFEKKTQQGAEI